MSEGSQSQLNNAHQKTDSRVALFRSALDKLTPESLSSDLVLQYRERMRHLLDEAGEAALTRDHPRAHFTASSFIFNPKGEALALFHRKLQRWLQPGGHIEPEDTSPLEAAMREALEESGLSDLTLITNGPIDLDIHLIPARSLEAEHEHFDLRYAFVTTSPESARISVESTGLEWLGEKRLAAWMAEDESISRAISLSRSLLFKA